MHKVLVCGFLCLICLTVTVFGQGSLTPPGAPAPTMKTLDQIEPRTPISSLPYSITQAGSYFVTTNLTGVSGTNGITISADNVTLNLGGFTLTGAGGSANGIQGIGARFNVVIRNGVLTAWTGDGIDAETVQNGLFLDLRISANGDNGIKVGANCVVSHCAVTMNGNNGIISDVSSIIRDCVSRSNGSFGFYVGAKGLITDCVAEGNTSMGIVTDLGVNISGCSSSDNGSTGFSGGEQNIFIDCIAEKNTGSGLSLQTASLVKNSLFSLNNEEGIRANGSDSQIINNTCFGNGFTNGYAGIYVAVSHNRVENNHVTVNGIGLYLWGSNNYVSGNMVSGNKTNYYVTTGNQLNLLISQIPETIFWPASVKLAGTLMGESGKSGITIASDDVTIDFDGHALIGVSGSLDGITTMGIFRNIVVQNGIVRGWGDDGIDLQGVRNSRVTDINVFSNYFYGIVIGAGSVINRCSVRDNGEVGISVGEDSSISDCVAYNNSTGIYADVGVTISRCTVSQNHEIGIYAGSGSTVNDCSSRTNGVGFLLGSESVICGSTALNNTSDGIQTSYGCLIKNCSMGANGDDGIQVSSECHIENNQSDYNVSGAGIHALGEDNRIDGNSLTDNQIGLRADMSGNLIIRNSASGNDTNYVMAAGNRVGGIVNVSGGFTNTNPWVNFSY